MNLEDYSMKECKKCLIVKPFDLFNKRSDSKDGFAHECRECSKNRGILYYTKNETKIKNYQKEYYINNSESVLERVRSYRTENIDNIREYDRRRRESRKNYLNNYVKNRRGVDILFRLASNLRNRTRKFLKNKSKSTKEIIGIELDELKIYLETLFVDGMAWDNYGSWHIDHIIPLSSAKNEEELIKLCHYTNLQPLYAIDNIIKSNKINNGITKTS
jgi:hypothetical protein